MNLKFWTWPRNYQKRRELFRRQSMEDILDHAIHEARRQPFKIEHHVTHAPRPPAPRPSRLTIAYQMQDGREYKEYVPLNGQMSYHTNFPYHIAHGIAEGNPPPEGIRYEFGYEDGGQWR